MQLLHTYIFPNLSFLSMYKVEVPGWGFFLEKIKLKLSANHFHRQIQAHQQELH